MPRPRRHYDAGFARRCQVDRSKKLRSRIFRTPEAAIEALFNLPQDRSHADWLWCWRQENILAARQFPSKAALLKILRSTPATRNSVMIRLSEFSPVEAGDLVRRGARFPTAGGRLVEEFVEHNRCHTNAALLWGQSEGKTRIVTGLAYGDDHWYPHSWGLRGDKVVETTGEVAKVYYGVVLDPEESDLFAQNEGV